MNKINIFALTILIGFGLIACQQPKSEETSHHADEAQSGVVEEVVISEVMGKDSQSALTPDAALTDLMAGNQRFVENNMIKRNLSAQVQSTATGQYPKAVILSCIDSRVPVEMVFDQGIGDMFVARVAGNVEDEDLLGSMEYGLGVAGSKLLLVLGHESCGAVKAAIDKVDVGSKNVDHLLAQVEPAISSTEGKRDSKDKVFVESVIKHNVSKTIKDIRERSKIISELEEKGMIKIVGAYYSLSSGKITLVD